MMSVNNRSLSLQFSAAFISVSTTKTETTIPETPSAYSNKKHSLRLDASDTVDYFGDSALGILILDNVASYNYVGAR
jgi:hypothetical protein